MVEVDDQLIQLIQLGQLGRVLSCCLGVVAVGLGPGAVFDPHRLDLVGGGGGRDGVGVQVPPFPALRGAQFLSTFRARRADVGEGGTAGDEHLVYVTGLGVSTAELDRAQAGAVVLGDRAHRVAGGGLGHPLGPGDPVGHRPSPPCVRWVARIAATWPGSRQCKCKCW